MIIDSTYNFVYLITRKDTDHIESADGTEMIIHLN